MKKNILLLTILCFTLLACKNQPDSTTANNVNQSPTQTPKLAKASLQQDTTPVKKPRSKYMVDRARKATDMVADYPYDIDLKTTEGKILNSSSVLKKNGKPTVILFWLTTCGPCHMEMAAIKKVYESWENETDFNLVAISTDFEKNYPNFVKMTNKKDWKWDTYNDVNREFRKVLPGGLNGLPQTFIFDKNGTIAYHKRKYRPGDENALYEKIKEIASN